MSDGVRQPPLCPGDLQARRGATATTALKDYLTEDEVEQMQMAGWYANSTAAKLSGFFHKALKWGKCTSG